MKYYTENEVRLLAWAVAAQSSKSIHNDELEEFIEMKLSQSGQEVEVPLTKAESLSKLVLNQALIMDIEVVRDAVFSKCSEGSHEYFAAERLLQLDSDSGNFDAPYPAEGYTKELTHWEPDAGC